MTNEKEKRSLYESIMNDVARIVKKHLNEAEKTTDLDDKPLIDESVKTIQ